MLTSAQVFSTISIRYRKWSITWQGRKLLTIPSKSILPNWHRNTGLPFLSSPLYSMIEPYWKSIPMSHHIIINCPASNVLNKSTMTIITIHIVINRVNLTWPMHIDNKRIMLISVVNNGYTCILFETMTIIWLTFIRGSWGAYWL